MSSKDINRFNYDYHLTCAHQAINVALDASQAPILTTKFTEDSAVLLHMVSKIQPNIPVVWVDTGYNSRATLEFAKRLSNRLNLSLRRYQPQDHQIRIPPTMESPDHGDFVNTVKLEPFSRAMAELQPDAWISSIRRYQTQHRRSLSVFESGPSSLLKVSPLLDWSPESLLRYLDKHDLPYGPTCFDPTKGEPQRECGLHVDKALVDNLLSRIKVAS